MQPIRRVLPTSPWSDEPRGLGTATQVHSGFEPTPGAAHRGLRTDPGDAPRSLGVATAPLRARGKGAPRQPQATASASPGTIYQEPGGHNPSALSSPRPRKDARAPAAPETPQTCAAGCFGRLLPLAWVAGCCHWATGSRASQLHGKQTTLRRSTRQLTSGPHEMYVTPA